MRKLIAKLKAVRFTQEQAYALVPLLFIGSLGIILAVNLVVYLVVGE